MVPSIGVSKDARMVIYFAHNDYCTLFPFIYSLQA